MLMKIFNKGQVVIPAGIRKILHFEIGDFVELELDEKRHALEIKKPDRRKSVELAGSFADYSKKIDFPSREVMQGALAKGLSRAR